MFFVLKTGQPKVNNTVGGARVPNLIYFIALKMM